MAKFPASRAAAMPRERTEVKPKEITVERVERALAYCAYLITIYGSKVVPIFERLERELAALKQEQSTMERANKFLEAYREQRGGTIDTVSAPLLLTTRPAA